MNANKRGRRPIKAEEKRVMLLRIWGKSYHLKIFNSLDPFVRDSIYEKLEKLLLHEIENVKK